MNSTNLVLKRIEELEKRVKRLEDMLKKLDWARLEFFKAEENEDAIRNEWYLSKDSYFRWVVEKIMHKRWRGMPSEAMHYLGTLSDDEKKNFNNRG